MRDALRPEIVDVHTKIFTDFTDEEILQLSTLLGRVESALEAALQERVQAERRVHSAYRTSSKRKSGRSLNRST
jgi:hypothetical protein